VFESPEQAHQALTDVGYLTDRVTATTVYLAGKLHKPLLLEGPAGSGKTELAYAVTRAARTSIERLQCFEGLTAKHAIGEFDESLQRLYLELATRTERPDWKALAKEITALDFFIPGQLLKAILAAQPCVLLIDELDKVDHAIEATLLEILSVWQISDPRLGTIPAESIPFTVLTSNEERRLGDPLRRRCLYLRIEYPTPEREGEIVARRTPEASPQTHRLIAGFAKALRAYRLEKPPSVSEMIDIALAIELLGIGEVTVEHRDVLLPLFAKTARDRKKLADLKDAFATILYAAKLYALEMETRNVADVLQEAAEEAAV
jgi:MoxR-like ATPase